MPRKLAFLMMLFLIITPQFIFAQDLINTINQWSSNLRLVFKAVIGLAAIGGGAFTYFKMQADDGNNGKKALLSFIGALIFAALMFQVIDFFTA